MCGICGFVGDGGITRLTPMMNTLFHRGPDSAGAWEGEGVSLGMRRLAIVDLESGQQPVFNEDGNLAVVFNGEIYNHIELRRDLMANGHSFRTDHSDTEVLVHLYEEYGLDFADHLVGMFAVALWDRKRRRLVLVRDHSGIKPVYYARVAGGGLVFGSEPKALLTHPQVSREPDREALHHYFSFKNIPAPFSAFKQIRQLRAGERLVWEDGSVQTSRWWRPRMAENHTLTEAEAAVGIRTLLEDSVRLQMRSDVPVGAYLSGGVDSSSVVALMAAQGARNVKTFTLVYEDGLANKDADRTFARKVAEHYGTDHHEHVVRFEDVPAQIDNIVRAFDEPFSGVISTYFITECISRHVKVALSGDGADEQFGSYLSHRSALPLAFAAANRNRLSELTAEERKALAPFEDKLDWLLQVLDRPDEAERRMALHIADDRAKLAVYSPEMRDAVAGSPTAELVARTLAEAGTDDPLNRALYVDFCMLLPDQVLPFVDRLSMAHSVEVRPPFLDHRLIEYVGTIPSAMKIRQGRVKSILKEAVRDLLPEDLLDRPKEGFIMPINDWILTRLRGWVEGLLSPEELARSGVFDTDAVARMLQEHYSGKANHGNRLWNMVMFQKWWQAYQVS